MKKLFLSGIVVCNFLNISYSGISFVCVWWYMKFHAWLPVFKIFLVHDCDSGLAFRMSLLFRCYSSSQILSCTEISRGSIHVSLLYNTYDCHTYNILDTNTQKGRKKQHNRPFYMKQPMLFCCCHTPSVLSPLLYTTGDVLQHELSNELCSVNFLLSLISVRYAVCTAYLYSTNLFLDISIESHTWCSGPVLSIVGII